jgi:dodecin
MEHAATSSTRRSGLGIRIGIIDDAHGRADTKRTESWMPDHTFAITHLVGTSPDGIDAAIRNGIAKASQTLRNLEWFEVTEMRGYLGRTSEVQSYQVTLKLGFRYDD